MIRPNFFIVGAPKCGTTAMNEYLAQHPDVFMAPKELHFFGNDLKFRERISESVYLDIFSKANGKKVIGEASVWYLFSQNAAHEIKMFSPGAKILIMLRDPVQVLYSLHSQHLYDGNEDITDFKKAIELDAQREKGFYLPDSVDFFQLPLYKDTILFSEQVKRYFDVFGKENVSVMLYDDFIADSENELLSVLQFIGLRTDVKINAGIINPNKKIHSFYLHRLLRKPPGTMKKLVRSVLPVRGLRHSIMAELFKWNVSEVKRKKMDAGFEAELRNNVLNEICRLEQVIDRDLSRWKK